MRLGKDLILLIDGTPLAASKSCTVNADKQFIDSCRPDTGKAFDKIPTHYGWSVSTDNLCADAEDAVILLDALTLGRELQLRFLMSDIKFGGTVFVQNWSVVGTVGSLMKFSVNFIGSGELLNMIGEGWDFIYDMFYSYGNFSGGVIDMGGYVVDGTLQKDSPEQEQSNN